MTEKETKDRDELFSRLKTMREAIDGVLASPDSIKEITKNLKKVSSIVHDGMRDGKQIPDLHSEAEAEAYIDAVKKAAPPGCDTSVKKVSGAFMARMILKAVNTLQREPEMENDLTMVWIVLNAAAKQLSEYLGITDAGSAMLHSSKEPDFQVPVGKAGNA